MILLSFDIEEFDMPFEYGVDIPFEKQLQVSRNGTETILTLLRKYDIKATFYCTANFAVHQPDIIRAIVSDGHEIASHGYYHTLFDTTHLALSKEKLEEISGQQIKGYRMARMMPVSEESIAQAGYLYNSSINPTFLPGRYNKLHEPRTYFYRGGILQLPASVTPLIRFPLFWLSFHNLPLSIYCLLCKWTLRKDNYLNVYFHPWEFETINIYKFPSYVVHNSGERMKQRLEKFIIWADKRNYTFQTTSDFIKSIQ